MNCEEFKTRLEELAADDPRVSLPVDLHEHQLSCASCRQRFLDTQESWLLLAAALNREPVQESVDHVVLRGLTATRTNDVEAEPRNALIGRYALAASVLAVLVAGTILSPKWFSDRDEQPLQRVRELARQMNKIDELETVFGKPQIKFVSLSSGGPQDRVQGYLVYDFLAGEGHFFGFDLPNINPQRVMLWLLDAQDNVLSSAEVDVTADGLGAAVIKVPANPMSIDYVLVSLEEVESAAAPSGNTVIRSGAAW